MLKKAGCFIVVFTVVVLSLHGCFALNMLLKAPPEKEQEYLNIDIETLDNSESCKKIGLQLLDAGHFFKAIKVFHKALSYDPNDAEAYNYLGKAYYLTSDNEKAKMFLKIAIRIKSDYADAYYNLGDVYLREGDVNMAMQQYKIAIDINDAYRNRKRNFFGEDFIPLE